MGNRSAGRTLFFFAHFIAVLPFGVDDYRPKNKKKNGVGRPFCLSTPAPRAEAGGVATLAVLGGVARFLFHDDRGGGVGGVATLLGSVAFGVVALFALLFALLLTTIKVIF